jgi:hypothetical protein
MSPFRLKFDECTVNKLFVDNGKFKYYPKEKYVDGQIMWERSHPPVFTGYKTITTFFYHNYIVLDKTPNNTSLATRRVTCKREPDLFDYDEILTANAKLNLTLPRRRTHGWGKWFHSYLTHYKSLVHDATAEFRDRYVSIWEFCNQKHVKRKLRLDAFLQLAAEGKLYDMTYIRNAKGKIKYIEWAKPGKYPRLIVDFTAPGSIAAGFLLPYIKLALSHTYRLDKMDIQFEPSVNAERLSSVFDNLIQPRKRAYASVFSDDSCLSVRCEDGLYKCNVDIKASDNSIREPTFKILEYLCSTSSYTEKCAKSLHEQCKRNISLRNPWRTQDRFVMRPEEDNMGSGNSGTTVYNTLSSMCIYLRFAYLTRNMNSIRKSQVPGLVERAARDVGIGVTVVPVTHIEEFQFLKCSPSIVNGKVVPWLNLGPIFRSLGNCDYDYPGRGDIMERGRKRNCEIIRGYMPCGNHEVMDTLKEVWPPAAKPHFESYIAENWVPAINIERVPIESLCRRYNILVEAMRELLAEIRLHRDGHVYKHEVLDRIYLLDYG